MNSTVTVAVAVTVGLIGLVGLTVVRVWARRWGRAREQQRQLQRTWTALADRVATVNRLWDEHQTDLMLALRYPLMTDPAFPPAAALMAVMQTVKRLDLTTPKRAMVKTITLRARTLEAAWFTLKFEAYRIGWGRLTLPQQHKLRQATAHLQAARDHRGTADQAAVELAEALRLADEVAAAGGFRLPDRARSAMSR